MPDQVASNESDTLLSWSFDERELHQRSFGWYISAIGVVILLLVYAFFSENFLFGILIILAGLVFVILHRKREVIYFSVTPDGVHINDQVYSFDAIRHFYVIYQPPEIKKLYFDLKGLQNRLIIPLLDHDPAHVREQLLPYSIEDREQENEPVSDMVSRIFKL